MQTKKLNCIRDRLRQWRLTTRGLLTLFLAALLFVTPTLADGDNGAIPQTPLANKPEVTIQGNVVVDDNGAPTGFYELALCVRSPRRIYGPAAPDWTTARELTEAEYAQAQEDIDNGLAGSGVDKETSYTITYYPFSAASAVVGVNADVLTAVNWDVESVTYENWNGTGYDNWDTRYPRGINLTPTPGGNFDPDVWDATDPDPFPNVTRAKLLPPISTSVALDAEGDRSAFTAAAQADHYYKDATNNTEAVILTLSAHAPDNKPVVFKTSTPVAVVRFSYDLKRFPKSTVMVNSAFNATNITHQITGENDPSKAGGFWLGLDRENAHLRGDGKTPLTWLADTAQGGSFKFSDEKAAATEAGQVVWTKLSSKDTAGEPVDWQQTEYYYYLGANATGGSDAANADGTVLVSTNSGIQSVDHVRIPATQGTKVLADGSDENPQPDPADYSYYTNLLYLDGPAEGRGLRLKLVNATTFRAPRGGKGGTQILFYDWDDTLIGSLIVGKGDVRRDVNTYIEKTLVHPELRASSAFMADDSAGGGLSQEAKYASLEREYTYRGKYAYTVGGNDATEGREDGKEYPLTNKLDYVFTKRVNTYLTQVENGDTVQYVHPYSLDDPALDPVQDDGGLYPWVYGWAVVEDDRASNGRVGATGTAGDWKVMHDAKKIEDTWTTMGTGELTNTRRATMTNPILPTVTTVGLSPERTAPLFLVDADPDWTSGNRTDANNYAYTLSGQNAYLRFADFSDITTEMERYRGKDTLIVKAVYEEGPELFNGGFYQLVKEPYYNKFSNPAANAGGAYSVEVTLERATIQRGPLQGVNRVRQPAVRQDTTTDQKWIQDNALGVDHNLTNADTNTAKALTETTFTKVDIDNGEEITFSLSLSARQNKADYFIIEAYGNNFVSGTQRSMTNYDREGSAHTIDNYNYYTDESDVTDLYNDVVVYNDRDGSHGFVLYGTLNYLMSQATRTNRGEITRNAFDQGSGYTVLLDLNLRMDAAGKQPAAVSQNTYRPLILAAAQDCEALKTADVWNTERDCAELSYHQLQYYLLGDPIWSNRAAADAKPLLWCHLHASCAAAVSGKPTSWQEMVDFAKDSGKADGIGDLMANEIETMTGLRKADGSQYTSGADFQKDVVKAVKAGCESWVEIQYYIVNGKAPASKAVALAEARKEYWWYDKSTSAPSAPFSLEDLVGTTKDYFEEVILLDGTREKGWLVKLEQAKASFDANAAVAADRSERSWRNMTKNLVAKWNVNADGTEDTEKFADWDAFKTAFLDAVELARGGSATPDNDNDYWEKLQYLILHRDDVPAITAWPTAKPAESSGYWWKDGKRFLVVKDIPTLLEAVRLANDPTDPDTTALDRVDLAMLEDTLHLRGSKKGEKFATLPEYAGMTDAQIRDAVIGKLTAVKDDPGVTDWNAVQYYLARGSVPTLDQANGESDYYWWKDGGTGTEGDFSQDFSKATAQSLIETLVGSVVRASYGDPKALDQIADGEMIFTKLHLVSGWTGPGAPIQKTELTRFTVSDFLSKMEDVLDKARTAEGKTEEYETPTTLNWYMVQYALLHNGNYVVYNSNDYKAAVEEYWWYDKEDNVPPPPPGKPEECSDPLMKYIEDHLNGVTGVETIAKLKTKLTVPKLNGTGAQAEKFYIMSNSAGDVWPTAKLTQAKNILEKLVADLKAAVDANPDKSVNTVGTFADGKYTLEVSWAQMQYYFATAYAADATGKTAGTLLSNADALHEIIHTWGWSKAGGGGIEKIPADIDLTAAASLLAMEETQEVEAAAPSLDDLRTQIEEMERKLAEMKEQLAKLEETAEEVETAAPVKPASTPVTDPLSPTIPGKDDTVSDKDDPVSDPQSAPDHDERAETPLGEEATWQAVFTAAELPKRLIALTPSPWWKARWTA